MTEDLNEDPRFQNLLGKAETHAWKFRPRETAALEQEGSLAAVMEQRARACWDSLKSARQAGMNMIEAEEIALPFILLPDEDDEDL